MTTSKTNQARAQRAKDSINHYFRERDNEEPEDGGTLWLADFMADVLHLCEREGIDFPETMMIAWEHHREEKAGCDDYLDEEDV